MFVKFSLPYGDFQSRIKNISLCCARPTRKKEVWVRQNSRPTRTNAHIDGIFLFACEFVSRFQDGFSVRLVSFLHNHKKTSCQTIRIKCFFANLKAIFEHNDEFGRIIKGIYQYCNVYLYNLCFVNDNFIS